MEHIKLSSLLSDPQTFSSPDSTVTLLQTHISFVALIDDYAYKIKKAVDFGFLDFSSLEKRKFYCEEELRLNKRLCPHIYDQVVSFHQTKDGSIMVDGAGDIVEYGLRMQRFSQDHIMNHLLINNKVSKKDIENICHILVEFYKSDSPDDVVRSYGDMEKVKENIDENFEQTKDMIDITIPKDTFSFIQTQNERFFTTFPEVFIQRQSEQKIHDCHGDLHSGNIVIDEDICIFDCIEFNKRFRYIDCASDIAFLAMDLDMMNHSFLSSFFIQKYLEKSKDTSLLQVLNFYKSYRAYVRGKVIGFQLHDPAILEKDKKNSIAQAQRYFSLSAYYAKLFSLDIAPRKALMFLVCGLSGTGKSTLASKLAIDYHAIVVNTDVVRKKIARIDRYERHHDEPNTGLYSPEKVHETYENVMEYASELLAREERVVLDATFQKRIYREMAEKIATDHDAQLVVIECVAPESIVKEWLEKRLQEKTVSDGRWEIYQEQKKSFEPISLNENHIIFDMSEKSYTNMFKKFNEIFHTISTL